MWPALNLSPRAIAVRGGRPASLTPSVPAIYLPTLSGGGPVMAAGMKKMLPTGDPAATVWRGSDSAPLDIAWTGQLLDRAAAASHQGVSALYVAKLFDQSGNGNHLTETTLARTHQLYLGTQDSHVCLNMGRRTGVNNSSQSAPRRLRVPSLPTVNRNNMTVYMVHRETSNYRQMRPLEMGDLVSNPDMSIKDRDIYYQLSPGWDDAGTLKYAGYTANQGETIPTASLCVSVARLTSTGIKVWRDGQFSAVPTVAGNVTSRLLTNGGQWGTIHDFVPAGGAILGELVALIIYDTAHSDADQALVTARLQQIYPVNSGAQTHAGFFQGDSISEGIAADYQRNLIRQLEDVLSRNIVLRNWGQSGVTAQTMATYFQSGWQKWIQPGAINILHLWAGTNDIVGGRTAAQIWTDLQTCASNWRARCAERSVTAKVIIAPTIRRGEFVTTPAYETVRQSLNTALRANAADGTGLPVWDAIADYDADAQLGASGSESNTALFATDKIHLNEGGYARCAPIAQAAFAALGAS